MLRTWLLPSSFSLWALAASKQAANVTVIFCDDLGYGVLPVHRHLCQDNKESKAAVASFTPHLFRWSKELVTVHGGGDSDVAEITANWKHGAPSNALPSPPPSAAPPPPGSSSTFRPPGSADEF